MDRERRVRLTEGDSMERGIRCPVCGTYTSISDIIATGRCRSGRSECDAQLHVDVVVEE